MTEKHGQNEVEIETCKECPPKSENEKTNNSAYFAVLAFMALVGLSVAYTFIIATAPSDILQPNTKGTPPVADAVQNVEVKLQGFRYTPDPIQVKAGTPIRLTITRMDEEGCGNSVVFYSLGKSAALPKGQPVTFDLPAMQSGSQLDFGCSMRMVTGRIVAL